MFNFIFQSIQALGEPRDHNFICGTYRADTDRHAEDGYDPKKLVPLHIVP